MCRAFGFVDISRSSVSCLVRLALEAGAAVVIVDHAPGHVVFRSGCLRLAETCSVDNDGVSP